MAYSLGLEELVIIANILIAAGLEQHMKPVA